MKQRVWEIGEVSERMKSAIADEVSEHIAAAIKEAVEGDDSGLYLSEDGTVSFSVNWDDCTAECKRSLSGMIDEIYEFYESPKTNTIDSIEDVAKIEKFIEMLEQGAVRLRLKLSKRTA